MRKTSFLPYIAGKWFIMGCLLASCQEVIELELPNDSPQLVIEGYLTYWEEEPEKNNCTVSISTTGNYYEEDVFHPVSDALVEVTDEDTQLVYELYAQEDSAGIYSSRQIPMEPGKSYSLHVVYGQEEYTATGTLLPVAQLDSFTYRYQPERGFLDEGYYLYFSGSTPKDRGINYYRFTLEVNDSLYNEPEDYLIQSDEFLRERIDTLQLANYAFEEGDSIEINMYSINKNVFEYYNQLLELLFNDGGLFSSPPRNPTTNIENHTDPARAPLGFFQVSTVLGGTVVIEASQQEN